MAFWKGPYPSRDPNHRTRLEFDLRDDMVMKYWATCSCGEWSNRRKSVSSAKSWARFHSPSDWPDGRLT